MPASTVGAEERRGVDVGQGTSFGAMLRRLREAAGLTQEELAAEAGITPNAVGALERGERRYPYPHTVRALADALGLSEEGRASLLASVPRRGTAGDAAVVSQTVVPALPTSPTPLVGREPDVAAVGGLLGAEGAGARLVTLTGPGGVGKTRLALEVATRMAGRFPDGVAFVALAAVADPEHFVSAVAGAMGLREAGGKPLRELVHGFLREKRVLLVLDNLEHLLGAAPQVAALLAAGPSLGLLVTSRAPLRLRGEQEYPVAPLAVPDPARAPGLEAVAASPAAKLFVERAREANPPFSLTRKNAAAVAAICWRLDGLPLALELAAAGARFLSPVELLSRLDQALEAGGTRDLPERQRTMRSTLEWSHELLAEEERALFRRLSVFAGGFALEAAEAVAGEADAVVLLGRLVEQSLVTVQPREPETRYGMLEPIRQYASEKLEDSEEGEGVRVRHAGYYVGLAADARTALRRADQASWLDRLDREHDNLRVVLRNLLRWGEAERVAGIGWAIWFFWALRGHTKEGRGWLRRALAWGDALSPVARAQALYADAVLSFARGEVDQTAATLDEGIVVARAADDPETLATTLALRGLAALSLDDPDGADGLLRESLSLFRALDHDWGVSNALLGLAQAGMAKGDDASAAGMLAEAEVLSRAAGDWFTLSANLSVQALAARLRGEEEQAAARLRECVGLAAGLRDAWTIVLGTSGLAGVAAGQGHPVRAARLFGAAEVLGEKMGVEVSWSAWRALNERGLAAARGRIDAGAFEAAWADGRSLTLEEVVAEALAEDA